MTQKITEPETAKSLITTLLQSYEKENTRLRAQNAKLEARIEALTKELAESRASYHTTSGKWGEY